MVVDITGMNDSSYESLEELFVDKDTKALLSKWKTSNESGKTKEFETSMITDEEYMKLKEVFKVLHSETEDYSKYKKAFNALCKAAHIVPDGTIIIKYELSKGKDDDRNNLYVKYAENTRPITLPEGTKLYHQSVVGGIKELIPKWKLRGKNEAGYLCDKPRVYLTMSKSLPRISTDNKLKDRLYSYEVVNTPAKVFVDPLLPDIFQKAVYVETETPIPVKPLKSDTILGKIKEKITGDKEEKEDKKVSEMVVDVTNKEPVNELFGFGKKKEKKAADRKALSDLEFSYDKKYNAFCLSVSGYSIEKLQTMLDKKASELEDAKAEKKSAEDRQKKLEAQIKIDYLENVCNRCKAMIKKKKSYHNK